MARGGERVRMITTPAGEARVVLTGDGPRLAALGHGAGGGVGAADLLAVTAALEVAGWTVARVEQPYRVQGRRAPDRAPKLDAAWSAVCEALRESHPGTLLVGGRSSGARVACRASASVGAAAVVCLAFPLHPPGRPDASRAEELSLVGDLPLLVVQGDRDAFGAAAEFPPDVEVVSVPGDHSLRRTRPVAEAVAAWLGRQALA
jgi:uncharacterized protein